MARGTTRNRGRKISIRSNRSQEAHTGEKGAESAAPGLLRRRLRLIFLLVLFVSLFRLGTSVRDFFSVSPGEGLRIADVSSERLLADGSIVGFAAEKETHAWLGIPYASPPVEDRRWRAPEPAQPWVDTFDALERPPACPQLASEFAGIRSSEPDGYAGSEDCLYLNVWAPRAEPDAVPQGADQWPVMVWIHGGGNVLGYGGSSIYDGAQIAGREQVVVVTFNYRLGPLGWFSHPALRGAAKSPMEASGNFGTLDQIRALEWVQQNIAEFGGDPERVTLFGESAGGTNVLALMLSPLAKGLFHRAVAQSGSTSSYSLVEAEEPFDPKVVRGDLTASETPPAGGRPTGGHLHSSAEVVIRLLAETGVVPDLEAAREYAAELSDRDVLELLGGVPARKLLDLVRDPESPGTISVPRVFRDGVVLPEGDWLEAFRSGQFNAVPVILGSNRDEWRSILSRDPRFVSRRFQYLYRIRDPEDYERRARYASDLWKVRAVDDPARAIHASGRAPVYAYRFDWDEEPKFLGTELSELIGAGHGMEIPFLFLNFDIGDPIINRVLFKVDGRGRRRRLGARMLSYWGEFARTGEPGRGKRDDSPVWLEWSDTEAVAGVDEPGRLIVFDTRDGGGIRLAEVTKSRSGVLEAMAKDTSISQEERCELLTYLFRERDESDLAEARRAWAMGC